MLIIVRAQYNGPYPDTCDTQAATACEAELLQCKLFTGPVADAPTMCKCGTNFYGDCLRRAGCMLETETVVEPYVVYMRQCISFIMKYDCSDVMICGINCASSTQVNHSTSLIIPFNNYGQYYLRLRICQHQVHPGKLNKYGIISPNRCKTDSDFQTCSRWIPQGSYIPVALPKFTTFIEVDYCAQNSTDGSYYCRDVDPTLPIPSRVYGNNLMFPATFDVTKTSFSICSSDVDCLGSFCDKKVHPHVCSPKSYIHIQRSGSHYFDVPFG